MSDGKLIIETLIDTVGAALGLKQIEKTTAEKMTAIGSSFQRTGALMTASLTTPIALMGSKMVNAASDYEENINKVDVAFKNNSGTVKKWSETSLECFGLSKNQALEMTSLYGDMATSMGLNTKEASNLSISLAGLAGDLASFKNMSIDEVQTALNGIFTGETESLKRLGIVMTQTNLDAYALAKGFNKTTKEMSQAELVMLRYEYVMEMTKNAHGDYSRTADGTANSIRTFQGTIENLMITLGQEVLPIFTPLVQGATDLLKTFAGASPKVHKFTVGMLAATAAAGPLLFITGSLTKGIGRIATGLMALNKGTKFVREATKAVIAYQKATQGASLAAAVATGNLTKQQAAVGGLATKVKGLVTQIAGLAVKNPWTIAAAGAVALAVAVYKVVEAQNAEVNAAKEAAAARQKSIENIRAESNEAQFYAQKLEALSQVENKTNAQKQLMQQYVDKLNASVEGLNLSYDAETDKLNQTTDAIYKKIEAQKQEAIQAAYVKNMKAAYEDYANAEMKAADAQRELNQKQAEWNSLSDSGKIANSELQQEIGALEQQVQQYNGAMLVAMQDATKWSNSTAEMKTAWKNLSTEATKAGVKIPESLKNGIQSGKYAVPATIDELNALIKFDEAALRATGDGKAVADNLRLQMLAGNIGIQEAARILSNSINTQLGKSPAQAGAQGSKAGKAYASGIRGTAGVANSAGIAVANSAKNGAGKSLYNEGYNSGLGYAQGLRGAIGRVAAAAAAIADAAIAAAKKRSKIHSPSKRWEDEVGAMDGEGYAIGLTSKIPLLKKAGGALTDAAFYAASNFKASGLVMPHSFVPYSGINDGATVSSGTNGVSQTINIYQPVATPAETARALRNEAMFGLAGV